MQLVDRKEQLQPFLAPLLHGTTWADWWSGQALVCIDFGSMGCIGLIPSPHRLVNVLTIALDMVKAKGILLTGATTPSGQTQSKAGPVMYTCCVLDDYAHGVVLPARG